MLKEFAAIRSTQQSWDHSSSCKVPLQCSDSSSYRKGWRVPSTWDSGQVFYSPAVLEDSYREYGMRGWYVRAWTKIDVREDIVGEYICFIHEALFPDSDIRRQFDELVVRWTQETMLSSSSTYICMHEAYQKIIGMGEQVIPLIFEEMLAGHLHWSWALSAITRESPAESAESPRGATEAWLDWGRDRGLVA